VGPDDPVLGAAFDQIDGRDWAQLIAENQRKTPRVVRDQLQASGWLHAQRHWMIGLIPTTRVALYDEDITGNLKRPRRYDRRLLRACYMAAHNSLRTNPESRAFYDRKRASGKRHNQAVLALARRRISALWAIISNETTYQPVSFKAA
jgi:transposase